MDSIIGTNNIIKSKINTNYANIEQSQNDTLKLIKINTHNNNIQDQPQSPEKEFESVVITNWKGLGEDEKKKKKKEIIWKKIKPYSITMKTAKSKAQLLDYCEMETVRIFYQFYWMVLIILSLTLVHLIQYFNYYAPLTLTTIFMHYS